MACSTMILRQSEGQIQLLEGVPKNYCKDFFKKKLRVNCIALAKKRNNLEYESIGERKRREKR